VVALTGRNLVEARQVASTIPGAHGYLLNVCDVGSTQLCVQHVQTELGDIDVLINNAGGHFDKDQVCSELTSADFLDAMQVNLFGSIEMTRMVLPHMKKQGYGRVVMVSSRSGSFEHSWRNAPAYGVSKCALNMYVVQLAVELKDSNVLVNACCPGWVRTRMGGEDAALSPQEGADTPVFLATLPQGGPNGKFFGEKVEIEF
jgi:NAD(P)-dependent dehydrogenase (short-subunit alcohol dehydrogenase family)